MTTANRYYLVSRSRHGGKTYVRQGELSALAVDRRGAPLTVVSDYTLDELEDCFGDRTDWPSEAVKLVEAGATKVVCLDPDHDSEWMDAAALTAERETQAYIDAIEGLDDGHVYAVVPEADVLDAIRADLKTERYGRGMWVGEALAKEFSIVDGDGRALTVGAEVATLALDDDEETAARERGTIIDIPSLGAWPVVQWEDRQPEATDPRSFVVIEV